MDKKGLIEKIAVREGVSLKEAEKFVKTFVETISEGIVEDGVADIYGFAKFEIIATGEKSCRNPKTGETITVPAGEKVKVSLKKAIKDLIIKK